MSKKGPAPDFNNGYRGELIKLLLNFGCVTTRGLALLPGNYRMYIRKLHSLEKEGVVAEYFIGRQIKAARMVSGADAGWRERVPDELCSWYDECSSAVGEMLGQKAKQEMSVRKGETNLMMYAAGIPSLIDERQGLADMMKARQKNICFFPIQEMRHYWRDNGGLDPVTATRATGFLLCDKTPMAVYHTGKRQLRWSETTEDSFRHAGGTIGRVLGYGSDILKVNSAVMFYGDEKVLYDMVDMKKAGDVSGTLHNVKNTYYHLYVLPYNETGRDLLPYIVSDEYRTELLDSIIPDRKKSTSIVDCDSINGLTHELVYCIPDMPRLYKFAKEASGASNNSKFRVYCYEWQRPFVEHVCEDSNIEIQTVKGG